ncbi:MAG TPA: hypothetical protein VMT47_06875 [Polyangia bacterium]|jgi:hypothetical protein|nr:hypothetical protein [Polyangia bacterium]
MERTATVIGGAPCRPNISPAGVRRRRVFGAWNVAAGILLVAGLIGARTPWYWCLVVFLPAALAAVGFLQAGRKTCVSRAGEGTFEHEDFSKTPADPSDALRSRAVASGITRDAVLVGLAAAALTILATRL